MDMLGRWTKHLCQWVNLSIECKRCAQPRSFSAAQMNVERGTFMGLGSLKKCPGFQIFVEQEARIALRLGCYPTKLIVIFRFSIHFDREQTKPRDQGALPSLETSGKPLVLLLPLYHQFNLTVNTTIVITHQSPIHCFGIWNLDPESGRQKRKHMRNVSLMFLRKDRSTNEMVVRYDPF